MPWPSSASCRSISALFANATLVGRTRIAARGGEDVCVSALIGRQRQTLMLEQLFRPLRHTMPFEVTVSHTAMHPLVNRRITTLALRTRSAITIPTSKLLRPY